MNPEITKKPKAYRILSRDYIRKLASLLAGREKVTVTPSTHWAIDLKNKVLHYDENTMRRYSEEHVLGFMLHEIGHLNYTTFLDTDTEIYKKHPTISGEYCNAFEDIRIDSLMSYKYRGSMEIIDAMHEQATAYALESLQTRVLKHNELQNQLVSFRTDTNNTSLPQNIRDQAKATAELAEEFIKMNEAQIVIFAALATYYRNMNQLYQVKVMETLTEKLRPYVIDVLKEMENADIEWMQDTIEVQAFWEDNIYPIIKDLIPPEESKESQQMHQGTGPTAQSGAPSQGQQSLNQMNQAKAKARAQKGNQTGTGRAPMTPDSDDGADTTRATKAQEAIPKNDPGSDALVAPSVGHEDGGRDGRWYDKAREEAKSSVSNLTARLGRILRDNSFDRYSGRHRSGHIRKRGLYKFLANETKLFERKTELQNKSYAVSIVIDSSGSMSGARWDESLKATAMLVDTLKKMNIPSEVTVFSQRHIVAKAFHQPIVPVLFDEKTSEVYGGGTYLHPALLAATKSLASRHETDKFLICLTDGGVDSTDKKEVPQLIHKHRDIKFYGIGIGTGDELAQVFPISLNINNASEIPVEFAKILKANIKKKSL